MNISCSCIRGNYNITVNPLDKDNLVYQDMSDWMEETRYDIPETYEVTVTPPGESTGTVLTLTTSGQNKINADDVGCIKDGVWCFETYSCGDLYKKSIGIFYNIECCIRKALATEPLRQHPAIEEVARLINLAKTYVEFNMIIEATETLEIAQNEMDRLKCNCNC